MKMSNQRTFFVLPLICLLFFAAGARRAQAGGTVVPNNPCKTVINTAYSSLGVTFTNPIPYGSDGNVYADGGYFCINQESICEAIPLMVGNYGAVQANFSTPQTSVSITATPWGVLNGYIGYNPKNVPNLVVYAGGYYYEVDYPVTNLPALDGGVGPAYILTYTSGSADIVFAEFTETSVLPGQLPNCYSGAFCNLTFNNNSSGNPPTGPSRHPPIQRPVVLKPVRIGSSFQCSFDSDPGADFRALSTTDVNQPRKWTVLGGGLTEVASGQYQFTDTLAANSPPRLYRVGLGAQVGTRYFGNSLTVANGGKDGAPPLVILGEYSPAGPLSTSSVTLPAGGVLDVKFYGKNYNFTLYALSLVTSGPNSHEQTFKVVASQSFAGTPASVGVQTVPASGFTVQFGDLLAFAGTGPYYSQNTTNDTVNSDATYEDSSAPGTDKATPPGGAGTTFIVGLHPDASANYEYIADNFGNQGRNYAIGVDVSQSVPPPAGLVSWWRGEGNALDMEVVNNGALEGGVTFTNGEVGQAFNFDGTTGFVSTSLVVTNPQTFSLSLWFRTATTKGGVLISFDNAQTSQTGSEYDRNIYLDNTGAIHFGVWNSGAQQINSAAGYNDNNWHQVVGSLSAGTGLSLYVDGVLVGNNPAVTSAQENYNGYWRFGEDKLANWPYQPTSQYFQGQIDEVAIFNTALAAQDVAAIYGAGSAGMNQ